LITFSPGCRLDGRNAIRSKSVAMHTFLSFLFQIVAAEIWTRILWNVKLTDLLHYPTSDWCTRVVHSKNNLEQTFEKWLLDSVLLSWKKLCQNFFVWYGWATEQGLCSNILPAGLVHALDERSGLVLPNIFHCAKHLTRLSRLCSEWWFFAETV
jgi:hypothetical protein